MDCWVPSAWPYQEQQLRQVNAGSSIPGRCLLGRRSFARAPVSFQLRGNNTTRQTTSCSDDDETARAQPNFITSPVNLDSTE